MTHFLSEEKKKSLKEIDIEASEVNKPEVKTSRSYPFFGLNSIYRGEIAGFFKENAPARDCGSMSLIVEKAGGIVTAYNGKRENIHRYFGRNDGTPDGCVPSIVVSIDKELHEKIVSVLSKV